MARTLSEPSERPGASIGTASAPDGTSVTVCVSLFNYGHYVIDCLESVAHQTLEPLSLIVVDDASTDQGPESVSTWIEEHRGRFTEATLIRHASNRGLAAARNHAVSRARTPFVFILDADNLLYPRCLEALSRAASADGVAFAYSIIEQFGEVRGLQGCDGWSPTQLARGNYVDAMALLRRTTWERVGGYRAMSTGGWEDYDFWCRCVESELSGVLVPEILCRYRLHGRSMLRRSTDTLRNHLRVCDEIRAAHPWVEL